MKKPSPRVDVKKAAEECIKFLNFKKLDMVDYGLANIECYVPPNDDTYPELKSFAKQWKKFFDYAEHVTTGNNGEGFPEDVAKTFESKNAEIEKLINSNDSFWSTIREKIIPLYEKSPHYADWQKRWKSVMLFYDPIEMEATSTKVYTDPKTGEKVKSEQISSTLYPEGFVLRIDGREDFSEFMPKEKEVLKLQV